MSAAGGVQRSEPEIGTGALLIAFLGAPLIWALHLAASYFLVALDCGTNWNGAETVVVLVTILAGLAAAGTGVFAWRHWKRARGSRGGPVFDTDHVREFLAFSGALLAALFTVAIILSGISPFFLPMCSPS
jgi:hypothetical protein